MIIADRVKAENPAFLIFKLLFSPFACPTLTAAAAEGFACRPCHRTACDQEVFCLDTLSAERVCELLEGLLAARAAGEVAP